MIEIGKTYKKWTVLSKLNLKDSNGTYLYDCKCVCGKKSNLNQSKLLNLDRYISCKNCSAQNKKSSNDPYKDFIGQRFGKWLVIEELPKKRTNVGNSYVRVFLCECDCGTKQPVVAGNLKSGESSQCKECGVKNNTFICKFCKCKNHINIDIEENECELLGFCGRCDKFCCMNCAGDPNYHELFNT